jgi:hypothetical protein
VSESASQARKQTPAEQVLADAGRARATPKVAQPQPGIETNPFYATIFSESLSPEQKQAEVAKLLVAAGTKEQVRQRTEAHNAFKEWLQEQRKAMAQEVIKLTNTETFSHLQQVYDELGNAINEFEEKMSPLTSIVDALFKLRANGETLSAIKEINEQNKKRMDLNEALSEKQAEAGRIAAMITQLEDQKLVLEQDRTFFGMGGVRESARIEIARAEDKIKKFTDRQLALSSELQDLSAQINNLAFTGELANEKLKLKELLDLKADKHKSRVEDIVKAANGFVNKADENMNVLRTDLARMSGQVSNLFDANNDMSRVYAVLDEAEKQAEAENARIRDKLLPTDGESALDRLSREEKKMMVEDHIAALQQSSVDTTATFADLQRQSIQVKGMRDNLGMQMNKARTMATRGVAGVAERLSAVVTAVSQAAISESSAFAGQALTAMRDSTNKITMQETIKNAMGLQDVNVELERALADLDQFTSVQKEATEMARENLTDMRDLTARMKESALETASAVQSSIGIAAETYHANSKPEPVAAPRTTSTPFKLGKV